MMLITDLQNHFLDENGFIKLSQNINNDIKELATKQAALSPDMLRCFLILMTKIQDSMLECNSVMNKLADIIDSTRTLAMCPLRTEDDVNKVYVLLAQCQILLDTAKQIANETEST